jgi:NADPH:quinone reductase-like Zn-dependent oxidoreductase
MRQPLPETPLLRAVEVISTSPDKPLAERIRIRENERAPLASTEVRIGMLAMNILPADLLQMNGQYGHQPELPYVPGHEGVAVVLETGSEVADLQPGERVLPIGVFGVWSDELVVQRRSLVPVPSHANVLQQAMLVANPATAWVLLQHQVTLQPGQWVIQNAANSAVGQCTRQLASHLGIPLINVVRRPEAVAAEEGGHWLVDDGQDPDVLQESVRKITQDEPVVLGLDAIGGKASQVLASSLSPQGRLVLYGLLSGDPCSISAHDLIFRNIHVQGFWLANWFSNPDNRQKAKTVYPALMALAAQNVLRMNVEKVYELSDVLEAIAHSAQAGRQGKVLLTGAHFQSQQT